MSAIILQHPSRGLAEERFLRRGDRAAPKRQRVEVVGLNRTGGQDEDLFLHRRFGVALPLLVAPDRADRAAQFVRQTLLGPTVLLSPISQLHRTTTRRNALPKWLYEALALWQYANMANGQIVYIRRVANDDDAPNRIQELLDAKGMSQAELARLSNTSVSALNKVIKGTRGLDQEWMRRLAPHLGVAPAELLPREDNPLILDEAERDLLARYRRSSGATRQQLERVSRAIAPDEEADTDAA